MNNFGCSTSDFSTTHITVTTNSITMDSRTKNNQIES